MSSMHQRPKILGEAWPPEPVILDTQAFAFSDNLCLLLAPTCGPFPVFKIDPEDPKEGDVYRLQGRMHHVVLICILGSLGRF